jgi:hypothetical protein
MAQSKARSVSLLANSIDESGEITPEALAPTLTQSIEGAGTSVYDSASQLPVSGNSAGDTAFVQSTSRLYIHSGLGWYNVAVINNTPTVQSILDSDGGTTPFALATDGTPTTITITAQDSDGDALTYNYSADSDFGGLATISQASNVFTITPFGEDSATTQSGTITFSVTDGINTATPGVQTFTLVFAADWTALTQYQEIQAEVPQASGTFGLRPNGMSEDGTVLAIGCHNYDIGGTTNIGQVYVYKDTGSGYTKVNTFGPSVNEAAQFGYDVCISGNWMIVGAPGENSGKGAIYFYSTSDSGSTWTFQQKITVTTEGTNDLFGRSVSISGDYAIAAVPYDNSSRGRLYIYNYNGSSWTQVQRIDGNQTNGTLGDGSIGRGAPIGNNGLYIAYRQDNNSTGDPEVIIMKKTGTHTYSQQQVISAPSANTQNSYFGDSLKFSGDTLVFSSRIQKYMPTNTASVGAFYVYVTADGGSTWTKELEQLPPEGISSFLEYASEVDIDGDVIVVGRYNWDTPLANAGKIEVWKRDTGTWTLQNSYIPDNPVAGDRFGNAVNISESGGVVSSAATDRYVGFGSEGTVVIFK